MNIKRGLIALLIVFLTACVNNQAVTVVPMPIASATKAATAIVASLTPKLSPSKTPSPTIQLTKTIPVATLNAVATTDAIRKNLISRFPELQDYFTFCSPGYCHGVQSSPNGQWIYLTNFNTLDLFSAYGERVGKYSFYDIYGYIVNYSEGLVNGAHWSKDEQYLYISANPGGDGGPEPYFGYTSALVRVNLENGIWKTTGISGSFEFSPNDEYIIYSTNKSEIRIRNLQSSEEKVYFTPEYYLYFGNYVWSPDHGKVVFVGAPEDWYANDSRFAMLMIDVKNQTILQLYESSFPFYFPVGWVEANKIILSKFNQVDKWTLDLSTNPATINP